MGILGAFGHFTCEVYTENLPTIYRYTLDADMSA